MSQHPEPVEPRNLKASDADRDRVAERIRDAAADGRLTLDEVQERIEGIYQARTYAELEVFTQDLPAAGAGSSTAMALSAARTPSRIGGTPSSRVSVAIMGGASRKGAWVMPESYTAVAWWGGIELDYRDARFAARETTLTVVAIMGGIEITVPDDIDVQVDAVGIMGGIDDQAGRHQDGLDHRGTSGRPLLRIRGFAFWGGVEVKPRPRRSANDPAIESKPSDAKSESKKPKHHGDRDHDRELEDR